MPLTRRTSIGMLLSSLALAAHPGIIHAATTAKRKIPWKNWAGNVSCVPEARATPKTLDELVDLVQNSTGVIRAVGAGHSWSPLVPTEGTILSLRRFKGMKSHDLPTMTAKFGSGTKLSAMGADLDTLSQGMFNLPDIDEQSLAGAFSTGTHGTGLHLPALHDATQALTLVTASGEVFECSRSKNSDLFDAAKVSLGSLGVITDYTIKNEAAYNLRRENWIEDMDELMEGGKAQAFAEKHRHFELWYMPHSKVGFCQSSDKTDDPITGRPPDATGTLVDDMRMIRDTVGFSDTLRSWVLQLMTKVTDLPEPYIDRSWVTLTNDRPFPIYEMEYQVPLENGPKAMREIIDYIETDHPEVFVPLEYRYVDADDAYLSQFYDRKSVSISVHRYREGADPWDVFTRTQEIFLKYGGRPHWGKMHSLKYEQLKDLYPRMEDFKKIRQQLDPQQRFANKYIRELLGLKA